MPKLYKLTYQARDGQDRVLDFLGTQPIREGIHTTLLTGHNGSHKSTVLRELVAALALPESKGTTLMLSPESAHFQGPIPVICASGSVADRFPSKEHGGRSTDFDVPNYVYIGQRVGTNLLSKKTPLETAVGFALDASVRERFEWPFYGRAHQFAGIVPRLDLEFRPRMTSKQRKDPSASLLEFVQAIAQGKDFAKSHGRSMSQAMALHLTEQFTYDDFTALDSFLSGTRRGRIQVALSDRDQSTSSLPLEAIRLGLLADELALIDAQVISRRQNKKFSVYELSSGEYHMLTTILALGFSLREGAVVLIDEPENSLHPQWQQEFMATLFEMCTFMKDGHLVVSTHSPLIVSSAALGSTILDLTNAGESAPASLIPFGASADDILFEQFGIASSRNPYVVDIVQRAVALTERGLEDGLEFKTMMPQLRRLHVLLRPNDPLKDVLDALLEEKD